MNRKTFIIAILTLLTLPAVLVVTDAVAFYVHNRNNGSLISSGASSIVSPQ